MLPLRIIDHDFNILGEIDKYSSLQMSLSAYGIGTCELRINRYMQHADKLQKDNIFFPTNQTHKAYIIKHREIELDENGKATENWKIKAYQLKSIVMQRLIYPFKNHSHNIVEGDAETVMKHYINTEMINPYNNKRIYPNLVIAPNLHRGEVITDKSRYDSLSDKLSELGVLHKLSWDIIVDTTKKELVFDVNEGIDRSAMQSINSPVILSTEYETLKSMSYSESAIDYKNVAVVAGQGEGIERKIVELGNAIGRDRYELFVDARDISNETDEREPQPKPEVQIIADLTKRGNEKLSEHTQTIYCEGQVLSRSIYKYEKDYHLGDIITLQNKGWGITMDTTITESKEIVESGRYEINMTFGNDRPTLISKIKSDFKDIRRSLSK